MKLGVVCDTHNNLKNVRRIVELFNQVGVDLVVHTGDITKGSTLDLFSALSCELVGVFGNNDVERDSLDSVIKQHGFQFHEPPLCIERAERQILVVHEPATLDDMDLSGVDLVLHGHTHLQRIDRVGDCLIFNPGECAGHMAGYNAVGVVGLSDISVEILNF